MKLLPRDTCSIAVERLLPGSNPGTQRPLALGTPTRGSRFVASLRVVGAADVARNCGGTRTWVACSKA